LVATVQVFRARALVATQRVTTGGIFRFSLLPGRYVVSNTGTASSPYAVSMRSGHTVHLMVRDVCK
jgi:hypothetical protein